MQDKSRRTRESTNRKTSSSFKQFTNVQDAPANVRHRPIKLPDDPEDATALDIAVVGRPNAGKSSLMNQILDAKVSAVSSKYNTTRQQVLGIKTTSNCQLCFYDTPGLVDVRYALYHCSRV